MEKWREIIEIARAKGARPRLRRVELSDKPLERFDFSGIKAFQGEFCRSNLHLAIFNNAYLRGADFNHAELTSAKLRDCNLRLACFEWADLRWADLRNSDLRRANFSGANLYQTKTSLKIIQLGAVGSRTEYFAYLPEYDELAYGCCISSLEYFKSRIPDYEKDPETYQDYTRLVAYLKPYKTGTWEHWV